MRRSSRFITILLAVCAALGHGYAAEDPKPALTPNQIDAQTIFARQVGSVPAPTAATPALIGAYLWSGRADGNYRPFFQWELRLAAGQTALGAVKVRITTLGPSHQVLTQGPWQDWPAVAASGTVDADYRLNCTIFPAYQVELAWSGGSATFLAPDKGSVPLNISQYADQGFVVAVNLSDELDGATPGVAEVTWSDWNVGGTPAHGIVHTLHLFNDRGVEVGKVPVALPAAQVLKPGAVLEQHTHLATVPFTTLSMSIEQADEGAAGGEAQGFTGAKDVEVAFVHAHGALLLATVRNGLDEAQDGLVVSLTFQDKQGADFATIDFPVGHLAAGATADISAPLGKAQAFGAYSVSWKSTTVLVPPSAAPAAAATADAAPPASVDGAHATGLPASLVVTGQPGLSFSPSRLDQGPDGLVLYGSLRNHSGADLEHLHLLFVAAAKNESRTLAWRGARLAAGADAAVVLACGLPSLDGLTISTAGN